MRILSKSKERVSQLPNFAINLWTDTPMHTALASKPELASHVSKSLQSGTVRFPISASFKRAERPWNEASLLAEMQAMSSSLCWYKASQALLRSASACSSAVSSVGARLGAAS
jgi:hypothetical protein